MGEHNLPKVEATKSIDEYMVELQAIRDSTKDNHANLAHCLQAIAIFYGETLGCIGDPESRKSFAILAQHAFRATQERLVAESTKLIVPYGGISAD